MARQRETNLSIDQFPGYTNNADPQHVPPGAAVDQVNLQSRTPGNLRTRKGILPVTFASTTEVSVDPDA